MDHKYNVGDIIQYQIDGVAYYTWLVLSVSERGIYTLHDLAKDRIEEHDAYTIDSNRPIRKIA